MGLRCFLGLHKRESKKIKINPFTYEKQVRCKRCKMAIDISYVNVR